MKLALGFVLLCLVQFGYAADLTLIPNTYGADIVEAVVNIIRESCLFADDKRFLRRLAYVESHDGTDPKTYRSGYDGGIWQVDENAFHLTQNAASLSSDYLIILRTTGINWPTVTWVDLRKPLYSGIAAALYSKLKLSVTSTDMDWNAENQGHFWEINFHSGNSAYNFSQLANVLDLGCRANQQVDMVFVLDTSSSLNADDFARAKDFMRRVIQGFSISPLQTQVGVVSYSSAANIDFYLNEHDSQTSILNAINNIQFHTGSTDTAKAITEAVSGVFNTNLGARPNVVKVMVVITDGDSNDAIDTRHAAQLANSNGIITFSVGVGSAIHETELETIASSPACTHVYKASDYAEIKFLVEEIQMATCIAPVLLQINQTYTCQLSDCPPFVGPTGTHGVTLQTSITCGGMQVYSSFNNPYPSSAQYQSVQNTLTTNKNNISETVFNQTGQNLYINFKDNQGMYRNASSNCTASIKLCDGDCTKHEIKMRCYQDDQEIPCDSSPTFNCTEPFNFANPCTRANILAGNLKFPHPYQNNKFLMCDMSGKLYVVNCPPGEFFNADCSQCIGSGSLVVSTCKTKVPANINNPCSSENILAGKLFFPYPGEVTKYIHCDVWGHPWERVCPADMEWDQSLITCTPSYATDPCQYHVIGRPYLYAHPCDPYKYIEYQSSVQPCQFGYVFRSESQACVPIGSYAGTSNLVNTCQGAGSGSTTAGQNPVTAPPTVPSTTHAIRYVYSSGLNVPPCTAENIQSNNLYFPIQSNNHQYIQCDTFGRQWLRDCRRSGNEYYDAYTKKCIDAPVFVDPLIG